MKRVLKISTVLFLVVFWQKSLKAPNDYSKSAGEPIKLLLTLIENNFSDKIEVEIVNRHNGTYRMNSVIENKHGDYQVSTHIKDMSNTESDKSFTLSRDELTLKLNQELKNSASQLVIAGNYQEIRIRSAEKTTEFYTRRAFGLMALLRDGKTKMESK